MTMFAMDDGKNDIELCVYCIWTGHTVYNQQNG